MKRRLVQGGETEPRGRGGMIKEGFPEEVASELRTE